MTSAPWIQTPSARPGLLAAGLVSLLGVLAALTVAAAPPGLWVAIALGIGAATAGAVAPAHTFTVLVIVVVGLPNSVLTPVLVLPGVVGICCSTRSPLQTRRWILWPLLMFAALSAITLKGSLAPWETIQAFFIPGTPFKLPAIPSYEVLAYAQFLLLPAMVIATLRMVDSPKRVELFGTAVLLAAFAPVAKGLLDWARGATAYREGFNAVLSLYVHPNQFAVFLLALCPLLAAVAVRASSPPRRTAAIALLVGALFCLFLTYTRSAWIGLVLGLGFAGLVGGYAKATTAIALAAVSVALASGVASTIAERFSDLSGSATETSTSSLSWRLTTWERVLDDTPAFQLTGTGYATYSRRSVEAFGMDNPTMGVILQPDWRPGFGAHNDLLQTYVEGGLVGLTLWVTFLGSLLWLAFRTARRSRDPLAIAALAATVSTIVSSASDNVNSYGGYTLAALAVLVAANEARQARQRD